MFGYTRVQWGESRLKPLVCVRKGIGYMARRRSAVRIGVTGLGLGQPAFRTADLLLDVGRSAPDLLVRLLQ